MSRLSVQKGKTAEREVIAELADILPTLARSSYAQARGGQDAADIDGQGCPIRIEVKHQARPNALAALEQCIADADDADDPRPCVAVVKRNRGKWTVTLTLADFKPMLEAWVYAKR